MAAKVGNLLVCEELRFLYLFLTFPVQLEFTLFSFNAVLRSEFTQAAGDFIDD